MIQLKNNVKTETRQKNSWAVQRNGRFMQQLSLRQFANRTVGNSLSTRTLSQGVKNA